jgi:hypothetical protein
VHRAALAGGVDRNSGCHGSAFALQAGDAACRVEHIEQRLVGGFRARLGAAREDLAQVACGELDVLPLPAGVH